MRLLYDRGRLIALFGDDPVTLAGIERDFLDTVRLAARDVAATDDCAAIARAAHRLKGAAAMIGATCVQRIAASLEAAAASGDPVSAHRLAQVLKCDAFAE